MSMINCPECGKEISDRAKNCPNCGYPLEKTDPFENEIKNVTIPTALNSKPPKKKENVCGIVGLIFAFLTLFSGNVLLAIISMVLCAIAIKNNKKKSTCGIIGVVICAIGIVFSILTPRYLEYVEEARNENYLEAETQNQDTIFDGDEPQKVSSDTSNTQQNSSIETQQNEEQQEEIVYTAYTVSQMMNDLDSNALKAEETYKDQYVEITGRLDVIDSSGKYISLYPEDNEWAFVGVQCNIKNDEQKQKVMEMSKGDIVTLKGKVKSVGEVLGYTLDIDEIE